MRQRDQIKSRVTGYLGAALLTTGLLAFGMPVLAQQSVEKQDTSQQVKEMAAEGERAKVAADKNAVKKSAPPEAGTPGGAYTNRQARECGAGVGSGRADGGWYL